MSSNLSFKKCSDEEWDSIIENSHQSNLFVRTFFLKKSGTKYHLWKILQGQEIKAGICLSVDDSEKNSIENKFVIHNGIFFNFDKKRILSKRREDQFQITSFIINNLVSKYDEVFLSLDPEVCDIRPFQWYNYNIEGPRFEISIKYTSILDLSEFNLKIDEDEMKIFKNLEPVRRYSIRQAINEKFNVKFTHEPKNFLNLYEKFLMNNNFDIANDEIITVSKIVKEILIQKKGIVSYVYDNSENLVYSIVTGWDNTKAYYLYGVGSEKIKKPWQGTAGLWSTFKYIANNNCAKMYDFEGVNSPKRGWFKLGFGGELINYYQIKYEKRKIHTSK
ncbi:hypothetical protein OAB74_01245 [Candidatus Pelagibacter sp.]|nr:hypothetical protein [Candidatus Pelagibacter sp.]